MPPTNPRSLKLKNIIKDLNKFDSEDNSFASEDNSFASEDDHQPNFPHNLQSSVSPSQKENLRVAEKDNNRKVYKPALKYYSPNDQSETKKKQSHLTERPKNVQQTQSFRNRKSSCSSCSGEDFSPASDDDKEYKPSAADSSSSHNSLQSTSKKPVKQSCKAQYKTTLRKNSSSSSSGSSSSTSTSDSTSTNSDSTSSDSDSSSSSSDTESISRKKTEGGPQPKKQKQIVTPEKQEPTITLPEIQSLSTLQQLKGMYNMSSSDDQDCSIPEPECDYTDITNELFSNNSDNQFTVDNVNNYNPPINSNSTHNHNGKTPLSLKTIATQVIHRFGLSLPPYDKTTENQDESLVVESQVVNNKNNPLPLKTLAIRIINNGVDSLRDVGMPCELPTECPSTSSSSKKSRKRKRGVNKAALAKKLRNRGLEYKCLRSNTLKPARKMGPTCNDRCRLKCSEKLTEHQRKVIFDRYWNLGSVSLQREFIAKHMTEVKPKYQYKKIDSNRKPKHAFYLTIDNIKQKVCKIYFKRTLGINDRPIRTVIEKLNSSGIIEPDLRGKHEKHNQVREDLLSGVRRHIDSIPRIESHYLRKQTTREYIDGGKNITDLYNDYKKDCEDKGEDFVKIHIYRKVFNQDFNISFFIPKKDQCGDCVAYKNAEPVEKEKLQENYNKHLIEKEKSREEKTNDKKAVDENHIVACYDLQAMLQVPKGDVSGFYYKSRLNCLNFTITELKTDLTECYFWNEVEGQKGANEIGSCVFRYLREKSVSSSEKLHIIFYSDNCCGQQKNQFIFSMYIYAVKNLPNIQSITHKFLIKGHTQNEGDSVHSTIEKQIKKTLKSGPIYVPDQYITAIREAKKKGKKYEVKEMSHTEFYDIKSLQEYKLSKNTEGETIKINDIKIIKIEKTEESTGTKVSYKTSYVQEEFKEVKLQSQRRARPTLKRLYTARIPLAERKKEDLTSLIRQRAIPLYYASSFYNSIIM
ncbi:uncharacterized protein LOC142983446 [Anticarsia gemmatalis]|uniref:uncharacterized protein LOC142983446 n=1 Tax=Anticarsia gemmatalis TaxID=129554 RepID=UPI003F761F03